MKKSFIVFLLLVMFVMGSCCGSSSSADEKQAQDVTITGKPLSVSAFCSEYYHSFSVTLLLPNEKIVLANTEQTSLPETSDAEALIEASMEQGRNICLTGRYTDKNKFEIEKLEALGHVVEF